MNITRKILMREECMSFDYKLLRSVMVFLCFC